MGNYGTLEERVRCKSLLSKVVPIEQTIELFKDGMHVGFSGFTPAGCPKAVPTALADHVEKNNLQGKLRFSLFVGASSTASIENRWAQNNMIDRRWPYQTGKDIAKGINTGSIRMGDKHLSLFAQDMAYGFYTKDTPTGKLDIAIIEVSAITEDGGLVLTASCGIVPEILKVCDKIIVEVNTAMPSFEGMHDIIVQKAPPQREIIGITAADTRVGTTYVPCDTNKIVAIVESKLADQGRALADAEDSSVAIA
ncbi:MAG TPA: acetyl-CoA hydrolase, partial [Deltaproteobacteria bacterium]|nr:acetyl-CoA hydrolase [Deltaproteobacteria bacterium]